MQQCPFPADYVQGLVKDAKVSQGEGKGAEQVDPGESLMGPQTVFLGKTPQLGASSCLLRQTHSPRSGFGPQPCKWEGSQG